jgi:glycosyltransferase involved in cell wall biosynthesis
MARRLTASQSRAVDALVVPSRAMLETLRGYGVETEARIIPTGLDLEHFSRGDGRRFRARRGIPMERPVLVHIGRVAHEKNIDFLLHMLVRVREAVPGILLVIAGEGPARHRLESLGARLGLERNTRFIDYLDRDGELLDCYRAGDAFVFASRTETQGLVLLEAMALGVPVVSTAVMGTRDILEAERGALVAEEDLDAFAAAVVRLLGDRELRDRLSREAREHAAEWSAGAMAARLVDFYREILDRRRRRAGAAGIRGPGEAG